MAGLLPWCSIGLAECSPSKFTLRSRAEGGRHGSRAGRSSGRWRRTTQATPAPAAPAAKASQPAPAAASTAPGGEIPVIEGGRVTGQTTAENAKRDGLTIVDLSDDWLPFIFSEEPGKPQPLRPYLIDLANGRFAHSGGEYARAREDRFFEAFGIFPTLNGLRRRLADNKRHTGHERVKDGVLEELSPRNVDPV